MLVVVLSPDLILQLNVQKESLGYAFKQILVDIILVEGKLEYPE